MAISQPSERTHTRQALKTITVPCSLQTALQSLSLQNVGCSINACKAVAELLASQELRLLHLFNNMSDNQASVRPLCCFQSLTFCSLLAGSQARACNCHVRARYVCS